MDKHSVYTRRVPIPTDPEYNVPLCFQKYIIISVGHCLRTAKSDRSCRTDLRIMSPNLTDISHQSMTIRSSLKPGPSRPGPLVLKPSWQGLKSGPARKMWKSRRWLIKGDRRRLLRNYVSVRRRREHAQSNPATKVNDRGVDPEVGGPDPLKICRRVRVFFLPPPKKSHILH